MGFFTRTDDGPAGPDVDLVRVSNDTLRAVLDGWGNHYAIDDDGDLHGVWDGHIFFFFLPGDGDLLHVRGRWMRDVDASERLRLLELANRWNSERIFPKLYVRDEERDRPVTSVYAEFNVPVRTGTTAAQLEMLVEAALSTSLEAYQALDAEFPEAAAAAAAALEARAAAAADG